MNAFKRYVKKKGFKLENDYPWLPYNIKPHMTIETILCNSEYCFIVLGYTSISTIVHFNRDGSLTYNYD